MLNYTELATSWEELTHWKRLWCWEGLGTGGEGDARGWDGWMASLTRWTWVWVNCGSWWWTGRPGTLWFMGLQRAGHDWATELNWTEIKLSPYSEIILFIQSHEHSPVDTTCKWLWMTQGWTWYIPNCKEHTCYQEKKSINIKPFNIQQNIKFPHTQKNKLQNIMGG